MSEAGQQYLVDILLNVREKPGAKLGSLRKDLKGLASVGDELTTGFQGAVESMGALTFGAAKFAGAGAVAAAAWGVHLNDQLEQTQVSLASVLNANLGGGIDATMGEAAGWMKQMKQDARELPGTFADLLGIVQSGAASAFNSGLNVEGFERIAAQGMAAAKAMSVPMDQAGRELAQLLEGRAGTHNVFGARLGIHAQGFNEKAPTERVKILQDALGRFEPAIKVFGQTMDAQSSTLLDNAKGFLTAATGPLFNRVKGTITDINAWFTANDGKVARWASDVGDFLVDGFDRGKSIVVEYGPLFLDFVRRGKDEFLSIWHEAEPIIKSMGGTLKDFLTNPNTFDRIESVLKLYAATKIGGGALSVGKDISSAYRGASALGGLLGVGGAGAGAVGGAAGGGAAVAGGEASAGALAALGMSAGAAAAALAGMTAAVGVSVYYAGKQEDEQALIGASLAESYVNASALLAHGAGDASGLIDKSSEDYRTTLAKLQESSQTLADSYAEGVDKVNQAILNIADTSGIVVNMNAKLAAVIADINKAPVLKLVAEPPPPDATRAAMEAEKKRKAGVEGKGGVTIHKVEITVSSNQAPNQIARDVFSVFVNERRYRTSSPRVANFSAGR